MSTVITRVSREISSFGRKDRKKTKQNKNESLVVINNRKKNKKQNQSKGKRGSDCRTHQTVTVVFCFVGFVWFLRTCGLVVFQVGKLRRRRRRRFYLSLFRSDKVFGPLLLTFGRPIVVERRSERLPENGVQRKKKPKIK